ncbi:hypothetical protein [Pelagicoccus sp. SDUM812002]|uniref:ArnT family glycosyltransferase n=1 Tax=Pelagicoccus sp. SDUM812002 TaxID=3041266 RepID=UPI00280D65F0|nr:hypothetical protein [Pelagicoccus sp. SDUM812002]MDQ8187286.1 hypothetical protein [Pelagicoccus sp. SDUM812002]
MVPLAGAADASGYMNFARLLGEGRMTETVRIPEGAMFEEMPKSLFQPLGFMFRAEQGQLSPTYPIGLPLLLSLGDLHESELLVRMVYAFSAIFSCIGIWFLGTELKLQQPWRFYSVAILATSPLFLWSSLILMSDLLAACLAIWVLVLAKRSNGSRIAALFCGLLVGGAVLTRPSNVLLFAPVWVALWQDRASWDKWFSGIVGGIPALLLYLWSNGRLYGDLWQSGYGDLWSLFKAEYFLPTMRHYGRTLLYGLFALALPSALLEATRLRKGQVRLLLAWAIPFFGFYAFYFFTSQTWWFLRFILVALPAVILLSAAWFESFARTRLSNQAELRLLLTLTFLSVVAAVYWEGRLNILGEQAFERRYAEECAWAKQNLDSDTLVICMQPSGAFYYYTRFPIFRWDLAKEDSDWELLAEASAQSEVKVVAVLHEFEEERDDSILKRYPSRWELLGEVSERVRAYRMR